MYEQKKVMKTRTCRRKGAQEFNFKKLSATRIISNMRTAQKESKFGFNSKTLNKREIEDSYVDEIQEEWTIWKKVKTLKKANDFYCYSFKQICFK